MFKILSRDTCRTAFFRPLIGTAELLFGTLVLLSGALTLCAQEDQSEKKPDANMRAGQRTADILAATADWQPMLKGDTLDGWAGDTQGYVVEDGVLICKKGGKILMTEKQYAEHKKKEAAKAAAVTEMNRNKCSPEETAAAGEAAFAAAML